MWFLFPYADYVLFWEAKIKDDWFPIITLFQSLCDEVVGSSSTSSPSANSYCGDDAIGYTEVCEADGYRYFISSGSPDHEAEYGQEKANPNTRCK